MISVKKMDTFGLKSTILKKLLGKSRVHSINLNQK